MQFEHDDERDRERERFDKALETGDPDEIARVRDEILDAINRRIMNDDPNYAKAGWKG